MQVLLASALHIAYQDPEKDLFLLSDISHLAMSGIVLQYDIDTDKMTILSCMSRLFSPTQRRKSPSEKESLAAVDNVKFNEHMVLFNRRLNFMLADATWLSFLLRTKMFKVAMHNAAEYLGGFDRILAYNIKGVFSIFADIISRLYVFKITTSGEEVLSAAQAQYIGQQYPIGLVNEDNWFKSIYESPGPDEYDFTPYKDENYRRLAPKVKEAIKMLAKRACEAIVFSEFYGLFHGANSAEQIHDILMKQREEINKKVTEKLKVEENKIVDFKSLDRDTIQKMFDKLVSEHKYAIDKYNRRQRELGKSTLSYNSSVNFLGMTRSSRKRALEEGQEDELTEHPWVIPTKRSKLPSKNKKSGGSISDLDRNLFDKDGNYIVDMDIDTELDLNLDIDMDIDASVDIDLDENPQPPKKSRV